MEPGQTESGHPVIPQSGGDLVTTVAVPRMEQLLASVTVTV